MDWFATQRERKLVVLGIPFDVETDELKYHMKKFGELEECTIMRDHLSGQSRGFGYVTFLTVEGAKKATTATHVLNGRRLDVKVATPREEMMALNARQDCRIFVARIPARVTDDMFRSYFQKYGVIVDAYMPKDVVSKAHRGIGFVTFEHPESVEEIMKDTHKLGGSRIAIDRATPKNDAGKNLLANTFSDQYSVYSMYMAVAAAAAAAFGMEGSDFSTFSGEAAGGSENPGKVGNALNTREGADGNGTAQSHDGVPKVSPGVDGDASNAAYAAYAAFMAVAAAAAAAAGYDPFMSMGYGGEALENATAPSFGPSEFYSNNTCDTGNMDVAHTSSVEPIGGIVSTVHPSEQTGYGQDASYGGPSGYGSASALNQSIIPHSDAFPSGYGSADTYINHLANPTSGMVHTEYNTPSGPRYEDYYTGSGYGYGSAYVGSSTAYSSPGYSTGVLYGSSGTVSVSVPSHTYGSGGLHNVPNAPASYSSGGLQWGNRICICNLPYEATAEHLWTYFSRFGRVLDVYLPKDPKNTAHRGFGFVTFYDDSVAERVAQGAHEILGQPVALDCLRPYDGVGAANSPWPRNFCDREARARPSNLCDQEAGALWESQAAAAHRAAYGGLSSEYVHGWDAYTGNAGGQPEAGNVHRGARTDVRFRPY